MSEFLTRLSLVVAIFITFTGYGTYVWPDEETSKLGGLAPFLKFMCIPCFVYVAVFFQCWLNDRVTNKLNSILSEIRKLRERDLNEIHSEIRRSRGIVD